MNYQRYSTAPATFPTNSVSDMTLLSLPGVRSLRPADESARYPEDRRPHHEVLPDVDTDVRRPLLQGAR